MLMLWRESGCGNQDECAPGWLGQQGHDLEQDPSFSLLGAGLVWEQGLDQMNSHALLESWIFASLCHIIFISGILLHSLLNSVFLWPRSTCPSWYLAMGSAEPLLKSARKVESRLFSFCIRCVYGKGYSTSLTLSPAMVPASHKVTTVFWEILCSISSCDSPTKGWQGFLLFSGFPAISRFSHNFLIDVSTCPPPVLSVAYHNCPHPPPNA